MFIPTCVDTTFDYDATPKIVNLKKNLADSSEMCVCKKGNCNVAFEYKYTGGNAAEWCSVPFHEVALDLAAACSS